MMRNRAGFTLIEILIAVAILAILVGLVIPTITGLGETARNASMATTARQIRRQIEFHAAVRDVPPSQEGYPDDIDPEWFAGYRLPPDVWTLGELKVQVVHGPKQANVPNHKTFQVRKDGGATGHTAWYNAANGSFCVLVPKRGTDQEILDTFLAVNGLSGDDDSDDDDSDEDDD